MDADFHAPDPGMIRSVSFPDQIINAGPLFASMIV